MRLYRLDAIILFFKEADHRRVLHSFPTRRSSDLLALHNAPAMVQVAGETRTRGAEVRAAYAAFVPGVTLSAGATRQYTSGTNTRVENGQVIVLPRDPWSSSGSVGASVDLFTGGRRLFDLKRARAGEPAARADAVSQRLEVALEAQHEYLNVL